MPSRQIKTVELLVAEKLHRSDGRSLRPAFDRMFVHFSDEEYLCGIGHKEIIAKIYLDCVYKYKTVLALSAELHLDPKTLLVYRKRYLRLLAKYYFGLSDPTNTDLALLYVHLKQSNVPDQIVKE